jgi:NAD(P)-dependent dehydrogenase (short-subunit alcohol dehydrogenase family)
MGQLDGRVAVITASTRSIGRGIAEAYHAEGAKVVLSGRNAEKGAKAIEEMGGGDRLHFIAANASKQADIEALVDGTVEKFGRVDIIVPNAGGVANTAPVSMISDEEWQYELDFNINQTFWMTRRALKYMIPQQFGRIIGMSSMYGKISTMAVPGYITNKHAIIGLMKAVAKEVGTQGITANAICPGFVPTDMFYETGPATVEAMGLPDLDALAQIMYSVTCIQRPNTVEEVAAACVLLASDLGAGISGTTINVDGGASPY